MECFVAGYQILASKSGNPIHADCNCIALAVLSYNNPGHALKCFNNINLWRIEMRICLKEDNIRASFIMLTSRMDFMALWLISTTCLLFFGCIWGSQSVIFCLLKYVMLATDVRGCLQLCTLEFEIRRPSYYWLLEALGLYKPYVWEYSRLNISNTVMSKRKVGCISSWNINVNVSFLLLLLF